jgi:transposase
MYCKETIETLGSKTLWLSRVPKKLNLAREVMDSTKKSKMEEIGNSYYAKEYTSDYGGVDQRWFVIHSDAALEREGSSFIKRLDKRQAKIGKEFKKLSNTEFHCKKDADHAVEEFKKGLKYHLVSDVKVVEKRKYHDRGKPSPLSTYDICFIIEAALIVDFIKVKEEREKLGKFIIATNIPKGLGNLGARDFLHHYKQQQKVERGFRFLKSNEFLADAVFLKNQSRIVAMSMIMCLCLMIYTIAERKMRLQLAQTNQTLPNQTGKEVQNVTMRWIFQLFEGIEVLYQHTENQVIKRVLNIKTHHIRTLEILGDNIAAIYLSQFQSAK